MNVIACGRNGPLPPQNRHMIVFNGVSYRRTLIEGRLKIPMVLGDVVASSSLFEPMDMSGEFGTTYNGRIEWIYGHHLTGTWTIRPSGRLLLTCHGVQSGTRVDRFRDAENRHRL